MPRRRYKRRVYRRSYSTEPGIAETLVDLIGVLIVWLCRSLGRGLGWLWRRYITRRPEIILLDDTVATLVPAPASTTPPARTGGAVPQATIRRWGGGDFPPVQWPVGARAAAARPPELPPYRRRPHLLSRGERAFWHPLYHAVKGRYRIFAKVRLQDVVAAPEDRPDEWRWFRRICAYHVDFVICDPKTTRPLLVIELDDGRHQSKRRQEQDAKKDAYLAAAGMPILRVAARQAYDVRELAGEIEGMIGGQQT